MEYRGTRTCHYDGCLAAGYVPFAFFLYLVPLIYWYRLRRKEQQIH